MEGFDTYTFCLSSAPSWPVWPRQLLTDNVSCHRTSAYPRALFMDTFTSSDHHAHTAVPPTAEASLHIDALLQQHGFPPTSLHRKGHASRMTCYSKGTWRIPDTQSNYTPGRRTFADPCSSDILFSFWPLVKIYFTCLCSSGATNVIRLAHQWDFNWNRGDEDNNWTLCSPICEK